MRYVFPSINFYFREPLEGVDDTRTSGNEEHPASSDDEASLVYENRHSALNHIKHLRKSWRSIKAEKVTFYARMCYLWSTCLVFGTLEVYAFDQLQ